MVLPSIRDLHERPLPWRPCGAPQPKPRPLPLSVASLVTPCDAPVKHATSAFGRHWTSTGAPITPTLRLPQSPDSSPESGAESSSYALPSDTSERYGSAAAHTYAVPREMLTALQLADCTAGGARPCTPELVDERHLLGAQAYAHTVYYERHAAPRKDLAPSRAVPPEASHALPGATAAPPGIRANGAARRQEPHRSRCSSPCAHPHALSMPLRTHARFECTWCFKQFSRPSSLRTHIHTHTGEKPFRCAQSGCGRRFNVLSNLRRHEKRHRSQPAWRPRSPPT